MESPYLAEMLSKELGSSICDEKIYGFSLWRVFRSPQRFEYLNKKEHLIQATGKVRNAKLLVKNLFISIWQLIKLLLAPPQKDYCCFAFPRLYNIDGKLIDKITDPLVGVSELNGNAVVFNQLFDNYEYKSYRLNNHHYMLDACWVKSMVMSYVLFPFVCLKYYRSVERVFQIAKLIFGDYTYSRAKFFLLLSEFLSNMVTAQLILGRLKPRCIFVVNKDNYLPYIVVAKKKGIKVFELQHGVTHGDTPLYSGYYEMPVDPDYFCTFGKAWVGTQFAVPIERVKNIGWCYSSYIKSLYHEKVSLKDKHVLVISSPEISLQILEATILLANEYPEYYWGLRLHPHQELSNEERDLIKSYKNIYLQDKAIESSLSLMSYNYVIGENSSVVYEALSLGRKVGRICFCGLNPYRVVGVENDGFYYIKNVSDFGNFLSYSTNNDISNYFYSEYDSEQFSDLLND
ncbi:hypothetical protein [Bacteroides zoogleoformans]|uniref:hypothetical protein n=1 Tax=Bacteroides zoogleoformans TaxID=28119 RepID=UPI00248DF30F|nr:hypothetical protein [Bacteroides zoogleoformans]